MPLPTNFRPGDPIKADDFNAMLQMLRRNVAAAAPLQIIHGAEGIIIALGRPIPPGALIAKANEEVDPVDDDTPGSGKLKVWKPGEGNEYVESDREVTGYNFSATAIPADTFVLLIPVNGRWVIIPPAQGVEIVVGKAAATIDVAEDDAPTTGDVNKWVWDEGEEKYVISDEEDPETFVAENLSSWATIEPEDLLAFIKHGDNYLPIGPRRPMPPVTLSFKEIRYNEETDLDDGEFHADSSRNGALVWMEDPNGEGFPESNGYADKAGIEVLNPTESDDPSLRVLKAGYYQINMYWTLKPAGDWSLDAEAEPGNIYLTTANTGTTSGHVHTYDRYNGTTPGVCATCNFYKRGEGETNWAGDNSLRREFRLATTVFKTYGSFLSSAEYSGSAGMALLFDKNDEIYMPVFMLSWFGGHNGAKIQRAILTMQWVAPPPTIEE